MNLAHRAFAGGEVAPSFYARTDLDKYQLGLRTCRNFIVQKHGGVANRPGTKYIAEVKDSSKAVRLQKFVFNSTLRYVLEFGEYYIRFYRDSSRCLLAGAPTAWADVTVYAVGDLVSRAGTNYYCLAAHTSAAATNEPAVGTAWQTVWYALTSTIYEIPTPYEEGDLARLQFAQSGAVMYITHPDYAPRKLTRVDDTEWVLEAVAFGPSIDPPNNVAATGGAAGTIRYWAVTAVKEGSFEESLVGVFSGVDLVPSGGSPTTITWDLVAGAVAYNVYRSTDGATYGLIESSGGTPADESDSSWGDTNEAASTTTPGAIASAAGQLLNAMAGISATTKAYNGQYTIKYRRRLQATAGATGLSYGRILVYYSRDGETRVLAAAPTVDLLDGPGIAGYTADSITIDVPDNGYATLQIEIVPQVEAGGGVSTWTFTIDTSSAPNDVIEWQSASSAFIDTGTDPDFSIAPPQQPNNFGAVDRYPACCAFYQQRLMFASTNTEPEKVFGSRIGSFHAFTLSTPLQDDDAISFQQAGRQVHEVRHLIDLGRLLALTEGSEWVVEGDEAGILRPDAINPRQFSYNGASRVRPVIAGDTIIYIQARGGFVRDLKPIQATGSLGSYQGTDLSVFAQHLFAGYTIEDMDFALIPHSIVWAVRSDGVLLGLTYMREHGIWGWHRHDTDGEFENVCCLPQGTEDQVWLVVNRTINGSTKRYVEILQTREISSTTDSWFVDAGARYTGASATVITGLDHLEGETVSVIADGVVIHNPNDGSLATKTVSGGQITIASGATNVLVGLPYIADIETMDIDSADGRSVKESKFIVGRMTLLVEKSRGFHVGRMGTQSASGANCTKNLQPFNNYQSATELVGVTNTTPTSQDIDVPIESGYDNHGRITVRQAAPLPCTVLGIITVGNWGGEN